MNKHLYSLDYLRGFAAISVCLFHFTDKLDYLPSTDIFKNIFSWGHYGVEIFFIISGLVIPYSMEKGKYTLSKIGIFFKKRIIRIEPPFLISILLALALNYATTLSPVYNGKPFDIDYLQLSYHIGYLNAFMGKDWLNPVCWTLAIEFQYYILIALLFPLFSNKRLLVCVASLIIFNALSLIFTRNFVFNFAIFFTVGILLYRYLVNKLNILEAFILSGAVLTVLLFQYTYKEIVVVVVTCIFVLLPMRRTSIGVFLGNISFSLYLLHFPIGLRVINLTQRFLETQSLRQLMVIAALIISIAAAYIYYIYIEKPFKELAQRVQYTTTESANDNFKWQKRVKKPPYEAIDVV
ncbi:acyltransferase [Dyadobacter sp. CY312]|uniref:acyltransferase family protein n=1 Tax=Dyadobacter sp. CY312 TaxID=2907303 RepID=UPI001F43A04A|nr:acyltransferase [Dyadobacter sp. CY312]MCE7043641.1 acyltransferase [Dyadobacter sp. CY312]